MRKFIIIMCIFICLCSLSYALTRNISVLLNKGVVILYDGKIQEFQNVKGERVYPITYEGTTYLPIRSISSLFQERIQWDGVTNSIYLGKGELDTTSAKISNYFISGQNQDIEVLLNEDIKIYYEGKTQTFRDVNGKRVYPLSYNGTTYLPVRAISNLYHASIEWDGPNNSVIIGKKENSPVSKVELDKTNVVLKEGENVTVKATITPSNATNQEVIWNSSDKNIVRVSRGTITGIKPGKAIVTVTTVSGNKQASCEVIVEEKKEDNSTSVVTGIEFDKTELNIKVGEKQKINVKITPADASNQRLIWSSDNTQIASVSNGTISALKPGKAIIVAMSENGEKSATCVINVIENSSINPSVIAVTGVTINKVQLTIVEGNSEQLSATVQPSNATNKKVIWMSSNTGVATVNSTGLVMGKKSGTTVVTVKTEDGSKMASCIITVIGNTAKTPTTSKPTATPKPTATSKPTIPTTTKVAVTGIVINKNSMSLSEGESETLTAIVQPNNATNKNITWKTNNSSIVTITSSGQVTAKKTGTAIITATTVDGNKVASCVVTVKQRNVKVTSVKLNKTSITLNEGEKEILTATISPQNANNQEVTWNSDAPSIVTVTQNGQVLARKAGTATVTVTTADENKTATCKITVKSNAVKVTGIKLNKTSTSLIEGEKETLVATIAPENATNKNVSWSSSNPNIASISSSGQIVALKEGTVTITAKTLEGNKTATCKITIKSSKIKVTGIKLNKTSMTLTEGEEETLKATISPGNATNKKVKWKSNNSNVATVSENGKVSAKNKGNAIITAVSDDENKEVTCKITVKAAFIKVTGIKIDKTATITAGKSKTLTATITPDNATNKKIKWSTTNAKVATVSNGKVTGVNGGTATITATTEDGNKMASCEVTINVKVTGIKIDKTVTITEGKSKTLTATITPDNATNKKIKWSTTNAKVAKVSNGKVTGVKAGTATITATTEDGNKMASCEVTIKAAVVNVTGVTLDKSKISLKVGESKKLKATITPSNATDKNISWSSSDTKVAKVSNGKVTGVGTGTATITVKTKDGGKKATCKVTVTLAKLNTEQAGMVIANAARYLYENRRNEFAYNVSKGGAAYKGNKMTTFLKGTSGHYPGEQKQLGRKTKFFMDCSSWCYTCIHWSLGVGGESLGGMNSMGFRYISASKLGLSRLYSDESRMPQIKPGDVIRWYGHWAMYVGKGKIVEMVNYGAPSWSSWTLKYRPASDWVSIKFEGVYRIKDSTAEEVDIDKINPIYLNYFYKLQ